MKTNLAAVAAGFVFLVLGCADIGSGRVDFDPPDATTDSPPMPEVDCTIAEVYAACTAPGGVPGVCIFLECRAACVEDADCDDADPCTRDECFWGHCENDNDC